MNAIDRLMQAAPACLLLAASWTVAARPVHADTRFDATVSGFVDEDSGKSFDLDLAFVPSERLSFGAGAGRSDGELGATSFAGNSLRAVVDAHGERFGARLRWNRWRDADTFESRTLAFEPYFVAASGLQFTLIAQDRSFDVGYSVTGPAGRVIAQSVSFGGTGIGGELGWYGQAWSAYVRGVSYDYDSKLARAVAAARAPGTRAFPRLAALVNSVLTRTAGALDHEASIGIDRAFARSGLRFDLTGSRDAIDGSDSVSYTLAWRYEFSPRFGIEASVGATDSDATPSTTFAGLSFSTHL